MDQSPYTPPKSITPPPDQPSKRSWIRSFFTDLILTAISTIVGPIVLIAWGIGLYYGWHHDSLTMFHLIYAALILAPAIGIIILAFAGRAPSSSDSSRKLSNWIGTIGCCLAGALLLGLYAAAVFTKLWPELIDKLLFSDF